jgi:hypothetical protein
VYKYKIEAMKRDKNMDDPVFTKRLTRKFLDRWENEGGRICTASGNASKVRAKTAISSLIMIWRKKTVGLRREKSQTKQETNSIRDGEKVQLRSRNCFKTSASLCFSSRAPYNRVIVPCFAFVLSISIRSLLCRSSVS